jgi:hypothetical protein
VLANATNEIGGRPTAESVSDGFQDWLTEIADTIDALETAVEVVDDRLQRVDP